ncbi:MAG: 3-methyl-2-oxobutanoate hydroxymethyltransferase [Deltaproteobacteria bacterium]|nr:3-methyl-2-oxobutanoate hydroxymethyltransferase [Deltaproteobacteria bacterium]
MSKTTAPIGVSRRPITVNTLGDMKRRGERITMLTCYDATFAMLLDDAGIDSILVGDSLGMVIKGEETTLNVTVEEIAYHTKAVARGLRARGRARIHLVGDMPFMSYQASAEDALRNAALLLQAGANAVKLEGGCQMAPTITRLVEAGIPVMAHVGLTPQSVHAMGGFKVQGKGDDGQRVLDDALAVQEAGAYAVVLEGLPMDLAAKITATLEIPTIGIGAGNQCDGQVLVLYDLLGLNPSFKPKFVKHFLPGADLLTDACRAYVDQVQEQTFPAEEHSFGVAQKNEPGLKAVPYENAKVKLKTGSSELADLDEEDGTPYASVAGSRG